MTSLTFYGGINQIGGNKILLEDNDTKIFLDFGMNFEEHQNYFTEYMPPRKCNCLNDFIFLNLLPNLDGLYRRDYCKHMDLDCKKENSVDGVLISHAHIDHVGYVHFLRKDIPIYVSNETKAIMELFSRIGAAGFEEFTGFKPTFQFISKKRGNGLKRRDARDGIEKRDVRTFRFGNKFKIGDLEIVPYRVDHSLPGATAYIIFTSMGALVYTGDLRFHGRQKQLSYKFVEKVSNENPVFMISEGTRVREKEARTEEYVQEESTKHIEEKKGLIIANFPIRDTERLLTFYNTALSNNRNLIIEYRQAMLLDLLRKEGIKNLPKSDDNNIRIFYPKKSWGLVGRNDYTDEQIKQDYSTWEKYYLDSNNIIAAEEIKKNQKKFVMFMNYFQLNNLMDIKPNKNSLHIRSICEPFSEEMELDQKRIDNWLKKFGLYPELKIHSSGHANGPGIFKMIKDINPKKLFPIHTKNPTSFKDLKHMKIIYPKYGKKFSF